MGTQGGGAAGAVSVGDPDPPACQVSAIPLHFDDRRIRTAWDEEAEEWYFSVVDMVCK